ncbi:MAG: glycosyltransferase family 2 protein [Parasphingorhabdus sp.]
MKLIIQIPCFNEAESLPETLVALPRRIEGIDTIEILVIDDGSSDNTSDVAKRFGVHHILRHRTNRGLAAAFQSGINKALTEGADIIVNTDADNQYEGQDIGKLVGPVLAGEADVVIGDRGVRDNEHFGRFKRLLQRLGSATVKKLSNTDITDAVSGFRAVSRAAAQKINITSSFSYTTEMLIQAGRKRMSIVSVPVRTNGAVRPSRLFTSIPQFIMNQCATMIRAYAMYNPLKVFVVAGGIAALIGAIPILRFLYFFMIGQGSGHIQSLVIGGSLLTLGIIATMFGAVADLVGRNRQLLEQTLERLRHVEDALASRDDVPEAESKDIRAV